MFFLMIVQRGLMTQADYAEAALKLFEYGQRIAMEHGLILVDTKFEFGKAGSDGSVVLIDEVHTPDSSSRYWMADSMSRAFEMVSSPKTLTRFMMVTRFGAMLVSIMTLFSKSLVGIFEAVVQRSFQPL